MATLQLETPASMGTRDLVRSWLDSAIPSSLAGSVVEVDCSPLRTPTPSFIDELLKVIVVERNATKICLINAVDRAIAQAERSAQNRGISARLEVLKPDQRRSRALSRIRR